MKNIVTVKRLADKARRMYTLPEDMTVKDGDLVLVATHCRSTVLARVIGENKVVDDDAVKAFRALLGMNPDGEFLKVRAVYGEPVVIDYPDDTEDDGSGVGQAFSPDVDDEPEEEEPEDEENE